MCPHPRKISPAADFTYSKAGLNKTLKTSIAADLLISLASGTPFLGRFAVPEPGRVLFMSGESGLAALLSIAQRICGARGLTLASLDNFLLCPDEPRLDDPADVEELTRLVEKLKPVCVQDGPTNAAVFQGFVRWLLVPALRAGDIGVMDNLSGHKTAAVVEAIKAAGASICYLPPILRISIRLRTSSRRSKPGCGPSVHRSQTL